MNGEYLKISKQEVVGYFEAALLSRHLLEEPHLQAGNRIVCLPNTSLRYLYSSQHSSLYKEFFLCCIYTYIMFCYGKYFFELESLSFSPSQ
jgi:hypothetical protein